MTPGMLVAKSTGMKLKDFMSRGVLTVSPRTDATVAWNRMREKGIHHLVVTSGGRVRGIVSDRDLGGPRGRSVRAGRRVEDVMTVNPVQARPDATVRQAANLLRGRSIGCLPVVSASGRLQGIVTISDLLELIGRGTAKPAPLETRRRTSRRGAPRRGTRPAHRRA